MELFVQLLVSGISLGAVYTLLALGFVVVFKASGVINLAQPGLLMVGTYVAVRSAANELPFLLAAALGITAAVLLATVIHLAVVRPMTGRSVLAISVATLGVNVILQAEIIRRLDTAIVASGDPWKDSVATFAGLTIPQSRIAALIVCVVLLGVFFAWFTFSDWGVAFRAAAEDPRTAALLGIVVHRVSLLAWIIGGALATVAGLFLIAFPSPGLDPSTSAVALRALPAAVLGGLDSTGGAIIGGLIIGVTETLAQGYSAHLTFLGSGFHTVLAYAIAVAVLLIRSGGLFGTKDIDRV